MSRVAPVVPAETDLLCEGCGYVLNGLPIASNCPECGRPIAESTGETNRRPTAWEATDGGGDAGGAGAGPAGGTIPSFLRTSAFAIFQPREFYRTLATRGDVGPARRFAYVHWGVCAALFATAAYVHTMVFWLSGTRTPFFGFIVSAGGIAALFTLIFASLAFTTWLAAKLTVWEAAYRGYRLPLGVVLRGMYYHAAHYLPVAVVTLLTVIGYRVLLAQGATTLQSLTVYLYVLCGEVVVMAGYLFETYWVGMKNMMYANK